MLPVFRPLQLAVLATFLLAACADEPPETRSPSDAYQAFFEDLGKGNTDEALEQLAPEGALGSTFRSAGYYMMAKEFQDQLDVHGDVQAVIIDREESFGDDDVMVQGRIQFRDGQEMLRDIRFTREGDRWVGHM
ncbi:MAG: hypothetical protein WED00_16780 [Aquisalimonadaceae bacterium]